MSQLKVNAISDAAGANGNAIALATDGSCTVKATNNLSNRNLIINGAMNISQRATTSTANGYGSLDRWKISYGGADEAVTHAQHALTSSDTGPWAKGFRNSLHLTNGNQTGGADAGDYSQIAYRVEAQDLANSGWDYTSASAYITVSFWVKASVAQTYYCNLETSDGTAQLYSFSTGALSANTWTKVTKTIPGNANVTVNNDNGVGVILIINQFLGTTYTTSGHTLNQWAAAGSYADMAPDMTSTWWTTNDATFEITGVQLEVGDYATDFEHRSYGYELARCQRYFWSLNMNTGTPYRWMFPLSTGNYRRVSIEHPTTMRAAPTASNAAGFNNAVAGTPTGTQHEDVDHICFHWNVSAGSHLAYLTAADFSAEL